MKLYSDPLTNLRAVMHINFFDLMELVRIIALFRAGIERGPETLHSSDFYAGVYHAMRQLGADEESLNQAIANRMQTELDLLANPRPVPDLEMEYGESWEE